MNVLKIGVFAVAVAVSGCASTGGQTRSSGSAALEQFIGTAVDAAAAAYDAKENYEYTQELYQELMDLYERNR